MTPSSIRRLCAAVALSIGLGFASIASAGGMAVFDSANFGQNLLTAYRTMSMINNQITALQNQARMLTNMARNLERLDYSAAADIRFALNQINLLMVQAQGIAFEVAETEREYARLFPEAYGEAITGDAMVRDARERWQHSRHAFRQTMVVQAEVVEQLDADAERLDALLARSQSAAGGLEAAQAGNQLQALSVKQALQTQQLLAAQYRAFALEQARAAADEEHARAAFSRFIGDGNAYERAE